MSDSKKNTILEKIGFTFMAYFQSLLFLDSFEKMTYGYSYYFATGILGAFITCILFIAALLFTLLHWSHTNFIGKIIYTCFCLFLGINIFVGFFNKEHHRDEYSKKYKFTDYERRHLVNKITEGERNFNVKNLKILEANRDKSYYIVGKKRSKKKKYTRLRFAGRYSGDEPDKIVTDLKSFIPKDFYEYEQLILNESNSIEPKHLPEYVNEEGVKLTNSLVHFLSWQHPDYISMLILTDKTCKSGSGNKQTCHYELFESIPNKKLSPISEDIMGQDVKERLQDIRLTLKEITGLHQNTRTDLINDPYFLIYQGRYKEARQNLDKLPPERKKFCEKKLQAILCE